MFKDFHNGLAAVAESLNVDIVPLTKEWVRIYESRAKARGKQDAIKFCKELNTVAERYALHQRLDPIPWTKSDKNGYPRILNKFKTYLRSKDPKLVVLTLSVMRSIEVARLPISKDISTVTQPCSYDADLANSIIDFIPTWVNRFAPIRLGKIKYHLTVKNGPNGHALQTSDSDVSAVMADPQIYEAIRKVEEKLDDSHPMKDVELVKPNAIHSKLTQFPDKAGKTRTIAIIDYYSQRCLKPLHEGLMAFLGKLVSDGTFSHQSVGRFAQQKTSESSFIACTDLTAATDRFPAIIQKALLFELLKDDDLSSSLWTLLAERTFKTSWGVENVTYNCGQPMGCFGSWPLFATAHHLIVEYCAYITSTKKIYNNYRIIGDDNVITIEEVYEAYQSVMARLGLTINRSKTVISAKDSDKSGAEVAKQLYLNGINLTPLTPGFIRDIKKQYMFNTCLGVLLDRYEFISTEIPSRLINKLYRKGKARKLAWLIASNPINGNIKPEFSGYDIYCPWELELTNQYITKFKNERCNMLQKLSNSLTYEGFDVKDYWDGLWNDQTSIMPFALEQAAAQLKLELGEVAYDLDEREFLPFAFDIDNFLAKFDYVPDPRLPYQSRKELRHKRYASILTKIICLE